MANLNPVKPIDTALERAAAVAMTVGKPLKIRIQPDVYDYDSQKYLTWTNLVWTVDVEDVEEGRRLRELVEAALEAFAARDGAGQVGLIGELRGFHV